MTLSPAQARFLDQLKYALSLVMLCGGVAYLVSEYGQWFPASAAMLGLALMLVLVLLGIGRGAATGFTPLWSAVPLALLMLWYYVYTVFGEFSVNAILFHLQMGADVPNMYGEYLNDATPALLGFVLVTAGWWALAKRDARVRRFDRWAIVLLLLINPAVYQISIATYAGVRGDDRISKHFVPVTVAMPHEGKRLNYIHIFLESAERTYLNPEFGDVMAPLEPYEIRGLTALDMRQTALTGWSAAGITAANCGVPLLPMGVLNSRYLEYVPRFMPSAVCIGDILARDGYELTFIMGADMSFGGIGHLFQQHGYQKFIGTQQLVSRTGGKETNWGVDDGVVFEAALDEVRRLSALPGRYGLTIDTSGGHAAKGHVAAACKSDPGITGKRPTILGGVKCTNVLAARFLAQAEKEGLLRDTVVIIQNDHLAMENPLTERLDALDRRNFFVAFGEGISPGEIMRASSPADIMPTILELLGYQVPNNRAGLGVSMLSPDIALVEQLGQDEFDDAVLKDSVLRERLWAEPAEAPPSAGAM